VLGPVSPPVLSELLIVSCAQHGSRGRVSSIATQGDHLVVWAVRRMTGPDTYEVKPPTCGAPARRRYLDNSRFCTPRREPDFGVERG
jgi:hypothetical protein